MRNLLGLINYYAKRMNGFAGGKKTAIFSSLLTKNYPAKIQWSEDLHKAFNEIKEIFSKTQILKLPNLF